MSAPTFVSPVTPERALSERLNAVITKRSNGNPRSKQSHIGPSEIGEQCVRKLSYRLLEWDKVNTSNDPWASVCGTAIHTWLASAFKADKSTKWLVEHKVTIDGKPGGSLDLFDVDNGIVIDHKCVGATSMKSRRAGGPTEQQIIQLNMYGYGLEQEGHTVNKIALAFYPFGGLLSSTHIWIGDYDRQVALDAISRLEATRQLIVALDPEQSPERWNLIPASTSMLCTWCPWFSPNSTDLSKGCPGGSA